ncbi:MAG TPA: hypothetical protein VEP49_12250 [Acidimicrobiia bacterium]|nr:hypothetical protein [Acidimicrobiia bacterium]
MGALRAEAVISDTCEREGLGASVLDASGTTVVRTALDEFLRGERDLSGLELYHELERCTPLLQFHTMFREGPQNRNGDGLQQSYGDHNRLLMLGLDKLFARDVSWYRSRVDSEDGVTDAELSDLFDRVADARLTRDAHVALWLAAALHDCGMLARRGPAVDVEDGIVIGSELIRSLCPRGLQDLASFALRHHDYIKDVFLGEVPAAAVASELDALDTELRPTAMAALGFVQVAGAASLGTGRLTAFRVRICCSCLDGSALDDQSRATRLARLLAPFPERVADATPAANTGDELVDRLLDGVPVSGWHRVFAGTTAPERVDLLRVISEQWAASKADRVVIVGREVRRSPKLDVALNGSRILLVGG